MRQHVHVQPINPSHLFARYDFGRRAAGDQAAGMQGGDFVAEAGGHVDVVQHDDNIDTLRVAQGPYEEENLDLVVISSRRRFIEQQAIGTLLSAIQMKLSGHPLYSSTAWERRSRNVGVSSEASRQNQSTVMPWGASIDAGKPIRR